MSKMLAVSTACANVVACAAGADAANANHSNAHALQHRRRATPATLAPVLATFETRILDADARGENRNSSIFSDADAPRCAIARPEHRRLCCNNDFRMSQF
ncbi:hypothetical protein WN982_38405 [Paraburkholderia sp. IMGN_8]|uniref:hypothetical protein n=1 Tax=Paraburkholderia sp. IMGN_8 TaxID=3136564 RepID=UPI0031015EE7